MKRKDDKTQQQDEIINELLQRKKKIDKELKETKKKLYDLETTFLENTHGFPITRTLEYYINNRSTQKKQQVKDSDRIFSNIN